VQAAVGYSEVVLALAEVELPADHEPGGVRERSEQMDQLRLDPDVGFVRGGDDVQHTLPHLVEPVAARAPAPRERRLDPVRLGV
jgi:hypothetical protein